VMAADRSFKNRRQKRGVAIVPSFNMTRSAN
jgi:hypothetical protein